MFIFRLLSSKYFKITISFILLAFYLWFFRWIGLFCLLIAAVVWWLHLKEKQQIEAGNERFRDDNLFFRYGKMLDLRNFSVKAKKDWDLKDTDAFAEALINHIQHNLSAQIGPTPLRGKQIVTVIGVTDNDRPNMPRGFLKISFTGNLGAIFSFFITYELVGKKIVMFNMMYLLGIAQWYDKLFFVTTSPLTILSWIGRYLKGEYSIYAQMAQGIDNSFEVLDIDAYFTASSTILAESIIEHLKNNGMLEDEARSVIYDFSGANVNFGDGTQVVGNQNIVKQIQ